MPTVRKVLAGKGNQVWSVGPDDQVIDALRLMADRDVGALLVLRDKKIVGIMSERDYARKVVLEEKSSKTTPVSEIMTRDVLYVSADQSIDDCLALMTAKKIRHLPVLEKGELIGIVSIGDIVGETIAEKQFLISQLENYIKGYS